MAEQTSQPSPLLLFDTINAFQRSAIIKGAIELEVFTAIARGNQSAKALAEACSASERGMRILCDTLTVIGFLTKDEQGYRLTQDSAIFLDKRSPGYMGGMIEFLQSPTLANAFSDIAGAVKKGGTVVPEDGAVAPEHPMWVSFARAMMPMMALPAQLIAGRVLRE